MQSSLNIEVVVFGFHLLGVEVDGCRTGSRLPSLLRKASPCPPLQVTRARSNIPSAFPLLSISLLKSGVRVRCPDGISIAHCPACLLPGYHGYNVSERQGGDGNCTGLWSPTWETGPFGTSYFKGISFLELAGTQVVAEDMSWSAREEAISCRPSSSILGEP